MKHLIESAGNLLVKSLITHHVALTDDEFDLMLSAIEELERLEENKAPFNVGGGHKERARDLRKLLRTVTKIPAKPKRAPLATFIVGNWSFRPITVNDRRSFDVYRKGERSDRVMASLTSASDGQTWMFLVWRPNRTGVDDARPSFEEAKTQVLALLAKYYPEA